MRQLGLFVFLIAAWSLGEPVEAQERADFIKAFAGQWFVFDPQYGSSDMTCTLTLATDASKAGGRLAMSTTNCSKPLAELASWDIENGQLGLYDAANARVAMLGGSQQRVTGELAATERGLIVERGAGDEGARAIAAAIGRHRCVYHGTTQKCADPADLRKPAMTEDGGSYGSVGVLVNLNVREQPRSNAPILGTLPNGTCLKVNFCTIASDGVWCRARFGEQNGWVRKTVLRLEEWPVITFANSCSAQG